MESDDAPAGPVERAIVGAVKGAIRKAGAGFGPYAVICSNLAGASVSRRIQALKRLTRPARNTPENPERGRMTATKACSATPRLWDEPVGAATVTSKLLAADQAGRIGASECPELLHINGAETGLRDGAAVLLRATVAERRLHASEGLTTGRKKRCPQSHARLGASTAS